MGNRHRLVGCLFIIVGLLVLMVFYVVMPIHIRDQIYHSRNIKIEYNGMYLNCTDDEATEIVPHLYILKWKRIWDDIELKVPEVSAVVNDRYLINYAPDSNNDYVTVYVSLVRSHIAVGYYRLDRIYYHDLINYLEKDINNSDDALT